MITVAPMLLAYWTAKDRCRRRRHAPEIVALSEPDQLDVGVDGCCDLDDGGRRDQLDPERRRYDLTGGNGDVLRVAAAGHQRDAESSIVQLGTSSPTSATVPETSSPMMPLIPGGGW